MVILATDLITAVDVSKSDFIAIGVAFISGVDANCEITFGSVTDIFIGRQYLGRDTLSLLEHAEKAG